MASWARCLVVVTGLVTAERAYAEQPPDAPNHVAASERAAESERLAALGFEAYRAGEYAKAIEFYEQALESRAAAALYFNVARIYDTKLSAPDKALEYYRKALDAPDVTEALVEKSVPRIQALTALLEQSKPPEGPAPSPKQSEAPQPPPAERQPPSAQHQPPAASEDGGATSQGSTQETAGYVVGITGLVAAAAGLGLGGWALAERDTARATCVGNQCTTQGGVDAMSTAYDLATASTIALAAGGGLVAVGLGMVLFAPPSEPADRDSATTRRATGRTAVQLAVIPTVGGARLRLAGAFF